MKFIFDEKQNEIYKLESADSIEYKIENNKFLFGMYKLFLNDTGHFKNYLYDSIFKKEYDIDNIDHDEFIENFKLDFSNFINGDEKIFNLEERIKYWLED